MNFLDTEVQLDEDAEIEDPRKKQLSYSSLMTFHACPRKFELYKGQAVKAAESFEQTVTYAYGHTVGAGIQAVLQDKTEEEILFEMFLMWKPDLLAEGEKNKKSFWNAVIAVQKYYFARQSGYLKDYTLYIHEGKPAVELGFKITLPDGFVYKGFVDAVLQNKVTGAVMVLECKTTGGRVVNQAQYKNSAQAIGYSIVLDTLFPELSEYSVLYEIYKSTSEEWESLRFSKSYLQRALWIQELLLDIEVIKLYENTGVFPMRGESCFQFFSECEYLFTCGLSTDNLVTKFTKADQEKIESDNSKYAITVSLDSLIKSQLDKEVN